MTEIPESSETKMARQHLERFLSKALVGGSMTVNDAAKAIVDAISALIEEKHVDMLNAMSDRLASQTRNP